MGNWLSFFNLLLTSLVRKLEWREMVPIFLLLLFIIFLTILSSAHMFFFFFFFLISFFTCGCFCWFVCLLFWEKNIFLETIMWTPCLEPLIFFFLFLPFDIKSTRSRLKTIKTKQSHLGESN